MQLYKRVCQQVCTKNTMVETHLILETHLEIFRYTLVVQRCQEISPEEVGGKNHLLPLWVSKAN
jgi:hypothetical protein